MADWEEIKRLAADFQRAQLSSTTQRLSERNCIEIVQRLTALGLINVIYTIDGKEYLTPEELSKEIREELIVHGGRINLVDLQQILNVDLSHIQIKAAAIASSDPTITIVLGQLIDESYLDSLCEEINDKLQETGQATLAELTKHYELPADFLRDAIRKRLGSTVQGRIDETDSGLLYTEAFVARHRAKIRGALTGVTRPTLVTQLINQLSLQERLFYNILNELVTEGRLSGSLTGGRQDRTQFIPTIYTQAQNQWVDNFFNQNGYLEYDVLCRLGITDPKAFIKKRFKDQSIVFLSTCAVGGAQLDRVEAEVDEALSTGLFVDVMMSLPSVLSQTDAGQILQKVLANKSDCQVLCDSVVVSEAFIKECASPFNNIMSAKADKDAKENSQLLMQAKAAVVEEAGSAGRDDKKDQRRKKANMGKQGGGTQGREVKTKAVKKKYKGRGGGAAADEGSDDESTPTSRSKGFEIDFLSAEEIETELQKNPALRDAQQDLVTELASHLFRPLRRQYQEVARSAFLQGGANRRKIQSELEGRLLGLWTNVLLFDKGTKLFQPDVATQINKHVLKTLCTEITNLIFNAVATQHMMSIGEDTQMTAEVRLKLLGKFPDDDMKAVLTKLHTSLSSKTVEDFLKQVDTVCGPGKLEVLLKKPDKKKEKGRYASEYEQLIRQTQLSRQVKQVEDFNHYWKKQLVFAHRQALAEQLRAEEHLAMALHLAATLLFTVHTQTLVHVAGRSIPAVISFLEAYLSHAERELLHRCQDLVMKELRQQSPTEGGANESAEELSQQAAALLPELRQMALASRRATQSHDE